MNDPQAGRSKLRALISSSSQIAGGAIGGALGFFAAGPMGAAALGAGGAAVAMALEHVGAEVSDRLLGPRERQRIGAVLAMASSEINDRIKNGEDIRSDGFFDEKPGGRSAAEEVAEAVVMKSQREPEELKLAHMAKLLANISFDSGISVHLAHQLTKTAESLTYRQLCILSLAAFNGHFTLRDGSYRTHQHFTRELIQVLHECYDLYQRGLISFGGSAALGVSDVNPKGMKPQGLGAELYNLMGLSGVSLQERQNLSDVLR